MLFSNNLINHYSTRRKLISVFILVSLISVVRSRDLSCANAKYFTNPGKVAVDLLKSPVNGESLKICTSRLTCCSQEQEIQVHNVIRSSYDKHLKQTLYTLSSVLKSRAHRFDGFFKELLSTSKKSFHDMFKRTYGIIYEQNSFLFTDLFEELEKYFSKGNVDLIEVMDNFFSILYQKMFTVLNAQYTFDDKYLVCVSEHMKDLKPFGDVPSKLSVQLKRSFVATRTFQQSLNVAGDIVHNMINMPISLECARSMTKMAGCPMCQGYPNLKPCYNYCANVMKGCVAFQSELDHEWNVFVDAIEKIAERLLGPFNIEMVVEPINIKISEAIMNFQENSQHVSQRVFSGCGKPILGRRKRQVSNSGRTNSRPAFPLSETIDEEEEEDEDEDEEDEDEEEEEEPVINNRQGNPRRIGGGSGEEKKVEGKGEAGGEGGEGEKEKEGGEAGNSSSNELDKLIKDIRGRVRQTRNFWSKLPYQMCNENDYFSSGAQDDNCWNGADRARYTTSIIGDGLHNQARNPEVRVDTTRHNSLLSEQSYALRTISTKLKSAYNGMDVEWIDAPEESSILLAGSGSGWGGPDDDEDTIFRQDPIWSSSQSPPLYQGPDSSSTEEESSSGATGGNSGSPVFSSSPLPDIAHIDLSLSSSTHAPSHSDDMDRGGPHDMDRGVPHGVDRDHEQDHRLDTPSQNGGQTPYGHDRNHDRHGSHNVDSNNGGNAIPGLNPTGPPPGQGDDNNHEDNNLSPVSGFKMEGNKNKYNVSGGERPSLNRALVSFLVPCLMMWVGNSLTDWWIL
uniref:Glypican-4 n=2 Tax=Cacopsylla melanoneura TaxID=428564 RepID=A0A8D8U7X6_9HEMI